MKVLERWQAKWKSFQRILKIYDFYFKKHIFYLKFTPWLVPMIENTLETICTRSG